MPFVPRLPKGSEIIAVDKYFTKHQAIHILHASLQFVSSDLLREIGTYLPVRWVIGKTHIKIDKAKRHRKVL